MSTEQRDIFAALSIAPTLDRAEVKRAYFREIAKHPPHQDPARFQEIREAYETLMRPGALQTLYHLSPPNIDAELERHQSAINALRASVKEEALPAPAEQFFPLLRSLSWEEALRLFSKE